MAREINIVVPMAGLGSRFSEQGYKLPKPLIDVMGRPMIEWVCDALRPLKHPYRFVFIVQEQHCKDFGIDLILKRIEPKCKIVKIDSLTKGPAITVMSASHLLFDSEVIVSVCDMLSFTDMDDFIEKARSKDGMAITFETEIPHFCFTELDNNGDFVRCQEKTPISTHAHSGVWYFKNGTKMLSALLEGISNEEVTNGEYYITIAYNHMGKNQGIYDSKVVPLGTPQELNDFVNVFDC